MAWRKYIRTTADGDHLLECGHIKPAYESKRGIAYSAQWCPTCAQQTPKAKPDRVWVTRDVAEYVLAFLDDPNTWSVQKHETAIAALRGALARKGS